MQPSTYATPLRDWIRPHQARLCRMPEAFGREVAVKTLVSVLSIVIVAALGAAWAAVSYFAPKIASTYQVSFREAMAWASVVARAWLLHHLHHEAHS